MKIMSMFFAMSSYPCFVSSCNTPWQCLLVHPSAECLAGRVCGILAKYDANLLGYEVTSLLAMQCLLCEARTVEDTV